MIIKDTFFIDGAWTAPDGPDTIEVISPASEKVVGRVPAGTPADIDRAVAAARRAFDDGPWRWTTAAERADKLRRIADGLERRADELCDLVTMSNGTPRAELPTFSYGPIAILRSLADLITDYEFVEPIQGMAARGYLFHEPVGVVAAITPWNGPIYLATLKIAHALAAGCTVVLKPPPETPLDTYMLAEAIEEAELPPGVVNIVPGGREVGEYLVAHPGVDAITFTGSSAAGRQIMAASSDGMKRLMLELGGKSAGIILDDVDLDVALPTLLMATTMLTGQACALLSRLLVPRSRHDEIVEAYVKGVSQLKVGDPTTAGTVMGPLVSSRQRDRVEGYIALGKEEGARIVLGGGRPDDLPEGWYVEPTVFVDVDNSMRIAQEEIFGPVIVVIPYDTDEEAVQIANDSDFGLHGAVFTQDFERGLEVARRVRAGSFTINGFAIDPSIPFGGFKQSGIGREGGRQGFEEFLETKAVAVPDGVVL